MAPSPSSARRLRRALRDQAAAAADGHAVADLARGAPARHVALGAIEAALAHDDPPSVAGQDQLSLVLAGAPAGGDLDRHLRAIGLLDDDGLIHGRPE